jgi:hypothetical protein
LAAVSFSKVTVADFDEPAESDVGVTEILLILPLQIIVSQNFEVRWGLINIPKAEKVLDFLLRGLRANVLNVHGGRHVCGYRGDM